MSNVPTKLQVSAGGVAFRKRDKQVRVAILSVGDEGCWQLPKGIVDSGESPESTALREVREEAGIETRMLGPIEKIEYWYYSKNRDQRVRSHKLVHFYLLRYISGNAQP